MAVSKETILQEIRRLAAANGGVAPGRLVLESEAGIPIHAWHGVHWTKWSDAVREAGFEPNELIKAYPKEHLLESLSLLARELNHFPTGADVGMKTRKNPGFPNGRTFDRLGSKREKVVQVLAFCRNKQGFDDVALICERALATLPKHSENDTATASSDGDGFVYLIKSGRHYKIGRTNDPDRRERELGNQTVEKNVRVHTIRTDDPSGIEAY